MNKKIVLDCLGGDEGLPTMLAGAVLALQKNPDLQLVLVGDEQVIKPQVAAFGSRVEIIHTTENIPLTEHPTQAIRQRPGSSMVLGLTQLKTREDCGACLSAGSTGALLTGGFMKIGRIAGVSRPAMCPDLPTMLDNQTFMLIDCGANMDCTPTNLVHFAVMANEYKKAIGMTSPRVALLNVGAEDTKGNEVVKQTHDLLVKLHDAQLLNFVGNIEADQVFKGAADIVVADGFTGNVLLKCVEGTVKFLFKQIKQIMRQGLGAKIGGLLIGGKIKKFKRAKIDAQVASIFLGLKKPVIKMHGNAKVPTVAAAIEYAATVVDLDLSDKIGAALAQVEPYLPSDEQA